METAVAHVRSWALTLAKQMGEEQYSFEELKAMNAKLITKIEQDIPLIAENDEISAILDELVQQQKEIEEGIQNEEEDATQLQYKTLSNALTIRSSSEAQHSARQASLSY